MTPLILLSAGAAEELSLSIQVASYTQPGTTYLGGQIPHCGIYKDIHTFRYTGIYIYICIYSFIYIYIYIVFHLKQIPCSTLFVLVRHPCSTLFDTLFDHRLFDLVRPLVRFNSASLFDRLFDRLFAACSTLFDACSTLVRPLVRRPCSTLFDRLFDVLVQSRPGPTKSEHSVAEVPCSIACSSGIVLQRYFVHRLFGIFLDRIFIR